MKLRNIKIYILLVFIVLAFGGDFKRNYESDKYKYYSPQETLERYFEYKNDKNKEKLLTTLTDKWNAPNMVWRFYNLKSIKMISMKEDTDETAKIGYLKYGRGSINGATVYKNFIFTKRKDEAACQKLY